MSPPPSPDSRVGRVIDLLPVWAALGLHAVAHGRWLVCAPMMVLLGWAAFTGRRVAYSPERLLVSGALGLGVGVAMLLVSEPPTAPFPPALFGPLCGALVGLTVLCGLGRNRHYAWTYASLLAALSLRVRELPARGWVLGAMALSLLAVAVYEGRLWRVGARAAVGYGVFLVLMGGGAWGLARVLNISEGLLMEAFYRMTSGVSPGSEFQASVELHSLERKARGSERVLLMFSGATTARLRTRVFDAFDGFQWTVSPELANARWPLPSEGTGPERLLVLTELTPVGAWLPAPAGTRAVEGASPEVQGGWVLRTEEVVGVPLLLRLGEREELPPEPVTGGRFTALPGAVAAELRPLAEALTRGASTPREKARALERYFQDEFEYSLNVDLRGEGSPLAVMVREKRAAYCTYFASAMAALLRSVGVPARVVGGFAPEEHNPLTGATLVRERDAHAWVEVYVADEGRFVTYDPTPWRSRDEALGMPQRGEGRLGQLTGAVGTFLRGLWAGLRYQPLAQVKAVLGSPVLWGLVVGFGVWRWRAGRRRTRTQARRGAMGGSDTKLAEVYARYLKTLERGAGLVPRPAETDDELLVRLRAARGEAVARVAEDFLALYRQARYGGEAPSLEQGRVLVDRLGTVLKQAAASGGAPG